MDTHERIILIFRIIQTFFIVRRFKIKINKEYTKFNKLKMFVLVSGKAGSGKNEVAMMLRKYLNKSHHTIIMSFAEEIKFIASTYFSWNGMKNKFGRLLLLWIGRIGRWWFPNIWADRVLMRSMQSSIEYDLEVVIVPDCRFVSEPCRIEHTLGTPKLFNIRVNKKVIRSLNYIKEKDKTETGFDNVDDNFWDALVDNNGTIEDLDKKVQKIAETITKQIEENK